MLNVPGTMLIVRRRQHGSGDPYYVNGTEEDPEASIDGGTRNRSYRASTYVCIPYGDTCMMLSFAPVEGGRKHMHRLKVLWNNRYVNLDVTSQQANAWFTYFATWKQRGHEERFEGFKTDGKMEKLYRSLGLDDALKAMQKFINSIPTI